jgi:hypothetical protein
MGFSPSLEGQAEGRILLDLLTGRRSEGPPLKGVDDGKETGFRLPWELSCLW